MKSFFLFSFSNRKSKTESQSRKRQAGNGTLSGFHVMSGQRPPAEAATIGELPAGRGRAGLRFPDNGRRHRRLSGLAGRPFERPARRPPERPPEARRKKS